ncbi:hypothetical protein C8R45DRAFT_1215820 [Mycena sanguinolenta]|nr:hypothetical protein C8R45DRAFT_1215820 [Mycena sanguinolenta]
MSDEQRRSFGVTTRSAPAPARRQHPWRPRSALCSILQCRLRSALGFTSALYGIGAPRQARPAQASPCLVLKKSINNQTQRSVPKALRGTVPSPPIPRVCRSVPFHAAFCLPSGAVDAS